MRAWQDTCCREGDKMSYLIKRERKAQEEIVGFVLVVVIVAVIFLVFLGIYLSREKPVNAKESIDVSQFLESAMHYTTGCITSSNVYSTLGDLIKECWAGATCTNMNNKRACDVLNKTVSDVIEANWRICKDICPYKGYLFDSVYNSTSAAEGVISIAKGNCSFNRIGGEYFTPNYPGTITTTLQICS